MHKPFRIRAASLWTSGYPNLASWLSKTPDASNAVPPATLLPARARGRATMMARIVAEVVGQLEGVVDQKVAEFPIFFGTSYSEIDLTAHLFEMMFGGDGKLSPARFQSSVYNAAIGQLSIATENRLFYTVLSAGGETVAATLLEALAWLSTEGGTVLVAAADEAPPTALSCNERFEPFGCGLILSANPINDDRALGTLANLRYTEVAAEQQCSRERIQNPCSAAIPLLEAIGSRRSGTVSVSLNSEKQWFVDYHA
jgi:hypothetical protein